MKSLALILSLMLFGFAAQAKQRVGLTSFGGIQVKVILDQDNNTFQIGESKFKSVTQSTRWGVAVVGEPKRVGIMVGTETLRATIWPFGGSGDDPSEYNCENSRITITREKDDHAVTVVKNECAYLE